jgi:oligopeptide/dipeptide ABC transporter ATP-binding protein
MSTVLRVEDLSVHYPGPCGPIQALDRVSLGLAPGESLGVLGESGCGKTTLGLALLGLLQGGGEVSDGSARLGERELIGLGEAQLAEIRGDQISMVFQEPALALNPVKNVGQQIAEVLRAHRSWARARLHEEVEALLSEVGLTPAGDYLETYPHQLSGGQQQRVVIAQALACRPAVVIADEPTTALDTITKVDILNLLILLKKRFAVASILISHDPAPLALVADRVIVMYAGQVVEEGSVDEVYQQPLHPYTEALLDAQPRPPEERHGSGVDRLRAIPGAPPNLDRLPNGCYFAARCQHRLDRCACEQPIRTGSGLPSGRRVLCHLHAGA